LDALKNKDAYEHDDEGLAFIKFFATPIEDLDLMAAKFIEEEDDVYYEKLKRTVRLLQHYEIMFWDAIFQNID
jgi:16S rRNA C1402 (ribose-2'-O) methylase RsmI